MSMDPERKIEQKERAYLVSTYRGKEELFSCKEHLNELEFLTKTFGLDSVYKEACSLRRINASTFLAKGRVAEIADNIALHQADVVIFDDEISPAQQRNLEKVFKIPVIDRTELILGVFAQRAQTKEAHLQVELAQLRYQYPRLKRMWTHLSRQAATGGTGAYLKGVGEKQIEIDRRLLRKRIELLESRIDEVGHTREVQRLARRRSGMPVFAIVGYTNAGKSTLLNALTNAGVFVEDKLFATLDTTTRKFQLSNKQEILLIDTVGFIRKLPHLVVAAFRSTLEEAVQADILLHVIDASHPMAEEQAKASCQVLEELNARQKPVITVLNKVDKCTDRTMITRLRVKYSHTVVVSAVTKEGFVELEERMLKELQKQRVVLNLRVPQKDYSLVSEVMRKGTIINRDYDKNDVLLEVEVPISLAGRLKDYTLKEIT